MSNFVCIFAEKRTRNMNTTPIRKRVIDMEVGETITIPVADARYSTLRCYAYEVGISLDRRYSTHLDRAAETYTITRKS